MIFLTVWNIKNDGSSNEKGNDLNRVSHRLKLRGHCGTESHVSNDDSGEGVDDTVGDSTTPMCMVSIGTRLSSIEAFVFEGY